MRRKLLLISGWAYGTPAMLALAGELKSLFEVRVCAAEEFLQNNRLEGQLADGQYALVAGWSLGGMLALEAISKFQQPGKDLVNREGPGLVLISSCARFCRLASDEQTEVTKQASRYGVDASAVRSMQSQLANDPLTTLRNFVRQVEYPRRSRGNEQRQLAMQLTQVDPRLLQEGLTYLATGDLTDNLRGICSPVLILHGRHDRVIPLQAAADLAESVRAAELRVHEDEGHALPLFEPAWVADKIGRFWTQYATS